MKIKIDYSDPKVWLDMSEGAKRRRHYRLVTLSVATLTVAILTMVIVVVELSK